VLKALPPQQVRGLYHSRELLKIVRGRSDSPSKVGAF
jgi:hypothetical protein